MKNKKFFALFLACVVVIFSAACANSFSLEKHTKYTLYIGMNDKDTNAQKFSMNEARKMFFDIASKYTDGYTLYEAAGFWSEDGKMFSENTLVCVLIDASESAVKNIMDEALKVFNQSSILVDFQEVQSAFYDGK